MVGRYCLSVLLANAIGTAGFLAHASIDGPPPSLDGMVFFGVMSAAIALLPLAVGMGVALLVLMKVEHPAWMETPWAAIVGGGTVALPIWALLAGGRVPELGLGYGAVAGISLWLCFRHVLRQVA